MNCQDCGARNEAKARFCSECGTPLEHQVADTPPTDDDETIFATSDQIQSRLGATQLMEEAEEGTIISSAEEVQRRLGATQHMDDPEEDATMFSVPSPVSEVAQTVSVTQEDVAAAQAQDVASYPPPEPPAPPPANQAESGGMMSQRNIIIAFVVLIVLCCCCFALSIIGLAAGGVLEEFQLELNALPLTLYFI